MKKKMLLICAALLGAVSIATAVESANIVGYLKNESTGQFYSAGPTFVKCLSFTNNFANAQWRLGDVIAEGMDPYSDTIQFLDPTDATSAITATYLDANYGSLKGWWDPGISTRLDNEKFFAFEGFLCNFDSYPIILTYAGEVLTESVEVDLSGLIYPMVANALPVNLVLGDITAEGMDPYSDTIQFLFPTDATSDVTATYLDASYGGLKGWWDPGISTRLDNEPFPAGTAFLGNFNSSTIKMTFPNPLNL